MSLSFVDFLPSLSNRATQKYSMLYLKLTLLQKNSTTVQKIIFIAPNTRHPLMVSFQPGNNFNPASRKTSDTVASRRYMVRLTRLNHCIITSLNRTGLPGEG